MHLQAGEVHLQYFMPRQPQDATDRPDSAACASSTTSPAATMWEYHQAHAALQPSPSWNPYAGTTAALLDGPAFTADSAPAVADMHLPVGDHIHGHAWSHGELSNDSTGYRENFLDLLASKNVTPEMFEDVPAGRYATAPASLTARFEAGSDISPMKYEVAAGSPLFLGSGSNAVLEAQGMNLLSCMPSYVDGHHQRKESSNHHQQDHGNPMASFLQQISTRTSAGVHASLDYSGLGGLDKICQEGRGMEAASPFNIRSLPDFSSFGGYRSTKEPTSVPPPPYMRCTDRSSDSSRKEQEIVPARSSSSGSGAAASDRKKRSSEERRESTGKKSKQEAASPPKVPKVKLGEKITALQQIVSPFGKTDTASVLFETIKYIKFLHEQVQLLSEPYTNASRNKVNCNNIPWGGVHAEASKGEGQHDLRERGLCLVPVSWTPEVYRDGNAMDYWTPAYRGCLYR
ncbi:uncharacterized protein [Lolium perenne]|uniref:uncharacterized protein isoform X2 n=1 Tax=Lolium perenne TaxID=4522 RepID=UPI0021F5CA9A|nr:uncharacterized protein LOC127306715 isoform X2 [Lolium perenne]